MENTENKFKYNGLWYIAVEQSGCRNCAFKYRKNACRVATCSHVPPCRKEERKDNKSVIFVESDADNNGVE